MDRFNLSKGMLVYLSYVFLIHIQINLVVHMNNIYTVALPSRPFEYVCQKDNLIFMRKRK